VCRLGTVRSVPSQPCSSFPPHHRAQYFLDDPREVRRMLNLLAERSSMGGGLQQAAREGHANLPSSISLQSLSVQSASSVSE
jgi:hypothetical protein